MKNELAGCSVLETAQFEDVSITEHEMYIYQIWSLECFF